MRVAAVQETPLPPAVHGSSGRDVDVYRHLWPLLAEFGALEQDDPRRAVLRDRLVPGSCRWCAISRSAIGAGGTGR